jgi:hypothetical protein
MLIAGGELEEEEEESRAGGGTLGCRTVGNRRAERKTGCVSRSRIMFWSVSMVRLCMLC